MPFPPPTLPTNRTNATVMDSTHPGDHNDVNQAVNDVAAELGYKGWTLFQPTVGNWNVTMNLHRVGGLVTISINAERTLDTSDPDFSYSLGTLAAAWRPVIPIRFTGMGNTADGPPVRFQIDASGAVTVRNVRSTAADILYTSSTAYAAPYP